jgi:mono/diheme cytochrome c family protein
MMKQLWFLGALAVLAFAAITPTRAQAPGGSSPFPDGDGKDIVAVACTQCHGPNTFVNIRENAEAWRRQTWDMIERGAQISPDEMDTVVKYFSTAFGPGANLPQFASVTLPDGQGKEVIEGGCGLCHGLDRIAAAKRSPQDWQDVVTKMVFLGAPLSADQAKAAVDYLNANFSDSGKTASAK